MSVKSFGDYLNESALTERYSITSKQIGELASMTRDAIGVYSRKNADDAGEFIGSMGEDIAGFGASDFNAVMKAYKNLKESTESDEELDEECGKRHMHEMDDEGVDREDGAPMNESANFGSVTSKLKKVLMRHLFKFEFDTGGGVDSFTTLGGREIQLVVGSKDIMVSTDTDYKEFKHKDVDSAVKYAESLL